MIPTQISTTNTEDLLVDVKSFIEQNPLNISLVTNPSEELMLQAIELNINAFQFIKNPSDKVIEFALSKDISLLQYVKDPSFTLCLKVFYMNNNSIKYIPYESIKKMALSMNGLLIGLIDNPSEILQLIAIKQNIEAIKLINDPSQAVCSYYYNYLYSQKNLFHGSISNYFDRIINSIPQKKLNKKHINTK